MKYLHPYITPMMEVVEIKTLPLLIISGGGSEDVQSVGIDDDDYDSGTDDIL